MQILSDLLGVVGVLNQRVNTSNPFVSRAVWSACDGEPDRAVLSGRWFGALDLSARNDLTAFVYGAEDDQRVWHVWAEFFAPALGLEDRSRRDRVPYDVWADEGWITLTPGATVDYEDVGARVLEVFDEVGPATGIGFDRWRMDVMVREIARLLGIDSKAADAEDRVLAVVPLVRHGQGFRDMAPPIDALESNLVSRKIRHGGNPVLQMCAANTVASKDPAGNRKFDKAKSRGRIDGMVALAMLHGVAVMDVPTE